MDKCIREKPGVSFQRMAGSPSISSHSWKICDRRLSLRVVRHLPTSTSRQSAKDYKAGVLEASMEETAEEVLRTTKDDGLWAFE